MSQILKLLFLGDKQGLFLGLILLSITSLAQSSIIDIDTNNYNINDVPELLQGDSTGFGCYRKDKDSLVLFQLGERMEVRQRLYHKDITALALSEDGRFLAIGDQEGKVTMLQKEENGAFKVWIKQLPHTFKHSIEHIKLSTSGSLCVIGTASGKVDIYQLNSGEAVQVNSWSLYETTISDIEISSDKRYIAVAAHHSIYLYEKHDKKNKYKQFSSFSGHKEALRDLTFGESSLYSTDGVTTNIWDINSNKISLRSNTELPGSLRLHYFKCPASEEEILTGFSEINEGAIRNWRYEINKLRELEVRLDIDTLDYKTTSIIAAAGKELLYYNGANTFRRAGMECKDLEYEIILGGDFSSERRDTLYKGITTNYTFKVRKVMSGEDVSIDSLNVSLTTGYSDAEMKVISEKKGNFQFQYELQFASTGEYTMQINVFDSEGIPKATIRHNIIVAEPLAIPGKNYALFIANEEYGDATGYSNLGNPINDATAIGDYLDNHFGFEVDYHINISEDSIIKILKEYKNRKYNPRDQLLVYFSGHGHIDGETNSQYVDIYGEEFGLLTIINDYVNPSKCRHILTVFDCCYSSLFCNSLIKISRSSEENIPKNDNLDKINKVLDETFTREIMTASDKIIYDGSVTDSISPFANYFLCSLKGCDNEEPTNCVETCKDGGGWTNFNHFKEEIKNLLIGYNEDEAMPFDYDNPQAFELDGRDKTTDFFFYKSQ